MAQKCNYLVDHFHIVGLTKDSRPCLRPENHEGAHLIRNTRGEYVVWESDLCTPNTCEGCDGEDPNEECLAYGKVSDEEAQKLIASGEYEGVE